MSEGKTIPRSLAKKKEGNPRSRQKKTHYNKGARRKRQRQFLLINLKVREMFFQLVKELGEEKKEQTGKRWIKATASKHLAFHEDLPLAKNQKRLSPIPS